MFDFFFRLKSEEKFSAGAGYSRSPNHYDDDSGAPTDSSQLRLRTPHITFRGTCATLWRFSDGSRGTQRPAHGIRRTSPTVPHVEKTFLITSWSTVLTYNIIRTVGRAISYGPCNVHRTATAASKNGDAARRAVGNVRNEISPDGLYRPILYSLKMAISSLINNVVAYVRHE